MKTLKISEANANQSVESCIKTLFPKLKTAYLQKAFRQRDIRVNGVRVKADYWVKKGDLLAIYIINEWLDPLFTPDIVYEDDRILIVNKPQGLVSISTNPKEESLIQLMKKFLINRGDKLDPRFPALCHRLDRNTGGLILIAKDKASLEILLEKMKNKEIIKRYFCQVVGKMEHKSATLNAFLVKDTTESRVYLYDHPVENSVKITTQYRVLSSSDKRSDLEVTLITGKTHQIRAHLAYIGHPILGDDKYGKKELNKGHGLQSLIATSLRFEFKSPAGLLAYLDQKIIEIPLSTFLQK